MKLDTNKAVKSLKYNSVNVPLIGYRCVIKTDPGATVTATYGSETVTVMADGSGKANLDLGAGEWSITASKNGLTGPAAIYTAPPVFFLPVVAVANTAPTGGVTYKEGLEGVTPELLDIYSEGISNNAAINNDTQVVYLDLGNKSRKVSIGDQVTIDLNGTGYVFDVIGFNHDTLTTATAYGSATKTGKAGISLQMHDCFATTYMMNSSNTNSGGWKSSAMRTSTMATMKGYLPAAWQTAIKPVNKVSGTGGGSSSGTETVSDSCFLLSEIEIFGSTTYSVSGEGTQYAYYKAGNSKVKNKGGSAGNWWERSPNSGYSYYFCSVASTGTATYSSAGAGIGVAFGFCV